MKAISIICHEWNYYIFVASDGNTYQITVTDYPNIYQEIMDELYPAARRDHRGWGDDWKHICKETLTETDYLEYANRYQDAWQSIHETALVMA